MSVKAPLECPKSTKSTWCVDDGCFLAAQLLSVTLQQQTSENLAAKIKANRQNLDKIFKTKRHYITERYPPV